MEISIKPLKKEDFEDIVQIDFAITNLKRTDYYKRKFNDIFADGKISCSLKAEVDGVVKGFLIGQVFQGEYGIPEDSAYIDTIGISPDNHKIGLGSRLIDQFFSNMKVANVKKIYTLVDFSDVRLIKFFSSQGFNPSKRLSLEMEL